MSPIAGFEYRAAGPQEWFDRAVEAILVLLLAFMPLALGAVYAWSEQVVIVLAAAAVLTLAFKLVLFPSVGFVRSWACVPIGIFAAVAFLQLAALPLPLVETISPHTASLKRELLGDLPGSERILSAMTLTFYPHATAHDLRMVLVLAAVFVVIINVYRDPQRICRLLASVAAIGGAVALLALAQDIAGNGKIYWTIPAYDGARSAAFINHSHYGQFMNLSIGAALGLLFALLHEAFRGRKVTPADVAEYFSSPRALGVKLLIVMIIVGAATVFVSLTRGGMIGMLIAAAFTTLVLSSRQSFEGRGWIVVLLALGTFICVLWVGFDQVYDRLASLRQIDDAEGGRWQIVKDIALAWTRFPLFGVGLGTHEVVYPLFDRSTTPGLATHAENEYAQAAEETGLAGLLALVAFGVIAWVHYGRCVRHPCVPIRSAAYGLGFGLLGILIQSLSDFGQHLPANAVLAVACCGLLFCIDRAGTEKTPCDDAPHGSVASLAVRVLMLLIVAGLSVWAVAGINRSRVAEGHFRQALAAERYLESQSWQGDDEGFTYLISHASDAADAEPRSIQYRYWLNVYRWRSLERYIDPDTGTLPDSAVPFAQQIAEDLHRARPLCPTFGATYCLAGEIEKFVLGCPAGAAHIRMGYRLAPCNATACLAAARCDVDEGRPRECFDKLARAVQLDGGLFQRAARMCMEDLADPNLALQLAGDDPHRLSHVGNLLAAAGKAAGETAEPVSHEELADQAEAKAFEQLRQQCEGPDAPASAHASLANLCRRRGDADAAIQQYRRALMKDYDQVGWHSALAQLWAESGRTDEAIHEARICLRLQADHAPARRLIERLSAVSEDAGQPLPSGD